MAELTMKGEKQMKTHERNLEKPSFWQLVFLQSKVNGAAYRGEQLPRRNWNWPEGTYLQQRLRLAKWDQAPHKSRLN
jgi:hypothetical protein